MKIALLAAMIFILGMAPGMEKYAGPPPPTPEYAVAAVHKSARTLQHPVTVAALFNRLIHRPTAI